MINLPSSGCGRTGMGFSYLKSKVIIPHKMDGLDCQEKWGLSKHKWDFTIKHELVQAPI